MAAPVLRPLAAGEVLDVSFGIYRSLFMTLLVVAIASRAIPAVLNIYFQSAGGVSEHWILWGFTAFLSLILSALGVAATTFVVSGAYLGRTVTANDAIRSALGLLGRLIWLTLMTTLIIGFGMILFLVPGVILFSGLALSSTVLVLEAPISPDAAMSRSWKLTKGSRWKVLLCILVPVVMLMVPIMVVGVITSVSTLVGITTQIVPLVLMSLLDFFIWPFIYVVITVLYYDMRVRKEGFDLELLAASATQA